MSGDGPFEDRGEAARGHTDPEDHAELDQRIAAELEGLAERLKADWRASGMTYCVSADEDGRPVYVDLETGAELSAEEVERRRAGR